MSSTIKIGPAALCRAWVGLIAGVTVLFAAAVSQSQIALGSGLVLAAALLGMVAVFIPIYFIALHLTTALRGDPFRASIEHLGLSLALVFGGLPVAGAGVAGEWPLVVAVGVVLLVHGGALLSDWINQTIAPNRRDGGELGVGRPAGMITALLLGSSVVLVGATTFVATRGRLTAGAAASTGIALFALVVIKLVVVHFAEIERCDEATPWRRQLVWMLSIISIVAGVVAARVGGWSGVVWAGTLLIGGLSVLGLLVHNDVPTPWRPRLTSATQRRVVRWGSAGVLAAVGWWMSTVLFDSWLAALGVFAVIVLVGAFFVLPGEMVFGAVLLSLLTVWIAQDTDRRSPSEDQLAVVERAGSDAGWLVALGDSFISGEGAPAFYEGTNTVGSNTCRRAPTAYPVLVGEATDRQVESFACSGATTANLRRGGESQMPDSPDGVAGSEPQLDALAAWLDSDKRPTVDAALLSIGGNDAGFSSVIISCLMPGVDCSELEGVYLDRIADLDTTLAATYRELQVVLAAGSDSAEAPPIYVALYPDPIGDGPAFVDDCNLMLTQPEAGFVRRFRDALNGKVTSAVAAVADDIDITLVPSDVALEGHELCEPEAYINWLRLSPPDGPYFETLNPVSWKNGSLHPAPGGHCVMARFAVEAMAADGITPVNPPTGCATPTAPPPVTPLGEAPPLWPDACAADIDPTACAERWLDDAAVNAGARAVVIVAIGVAAGMFLGSALSRLADQPTTARAMWWPWVFAREIWLRYDMVANGVRAAIRDDQHRHNEPQQRAPR